MARRPLPRQTITASVIVAMLTVPLAAPPAMAGVDLLGDDDSEEGASEGSSSEGSSDSSADQDPSGDAQSSASSGSSEGDLGQALNDVVNGVTGGSDEQQAAADSQEPQEVTPQSQAESQPAQPQPQGGSGGGGGGSPAQPAAPQQSQPADSGAAPAPAQPPAPSGPQRAVRPGVDANGQPPATANNPSFDAAIDRGARQPQAPEVFNEASDARNENVAALPSIPLMGGASDGEGVVVPNHLVAAACALAVIIAAAHSLHATRRLGPLRGRRS